MPEIPLIDFPLTKDDLIPRIKGIPSWISDIAHTCTQCRWRICAFMDKSQGENGEKEKDD